MIARSRTSRSVIRSSEFIFFVQFPQKKQYSWAIDASQGALSHDSACRHSATHAASISRNLTHAIRTESNCNYDRITDVVNAACDAMRNYCDIKLTVKPAEQ